ncbi:MAG: cytochrome C oxidase subunit IV family protein [Planctomycetaceae bacterium]
MSQHIVSRTVYFTVFGVLLVLLVVTVAVTRVDWGVWNPIVALAIAGAKAALIVLYFMHVRYAEPLTRIAAVAGFLWLALLLGLTYSDFATRDWLPRGMSAESAEDERLIGKLPSGAWGRTHIASPRPLR